MDDFVKAKIKAAREATNARRHDQTVRVFEFKIDESHVSKKKLTELDFAFTQAKWVWNDVVASGDVFNYNYSKHKTITHKDKDGNDITVNLKLGCVVHEGVVRQAKNAVKTLATLKKNGFKIGHLKFKSEMNCLYSRFPVRIKGQRIRFQGLGTFRVRGLDQLDEYDYELADSRLISRPSGYYIKQTVAINDFPTRLTNGKTIGIDLGCKNTITTSEGDKIKIAVGESERTKRLQRKLARSEKGSKRRYRNLKELQKSYERTMNQKKDIGNKAVAKLLENDVVCMQDEQLAKWQRSGHGKAIQHSCLGLIKTKLKAHGAKVVSKWEPTTQTCSCCGTRSAKKVVLGDETFFCPSDSWIEKPCPNVYGIDRDVNAARNMVRIARERGMIH
jgi:putative transposase